MQSRVFIIYKYLDYRLQKPTIGGVQTYITDLIGVLSGLNMHPIVCQLGEEDIVIQMPSYEARQIKVKDVGSLVKKISEDADISKDLIIYGTDTMIVPNDGFKYSIAIQHGINWDIPICTHHHIFRYIVATAWQTYKIVRRVGQVKSLVCVDYNFQNWYRTQVDHEHTNIMVIPNYTRIAPVIKKENDTVNIIFARRFFPYRGTRVFTHAIKRVLAEYNNVRVTIAGSGPDEEWMKKELSECDNVLFTKYESSESLGIHADKHIAVVPTVGSEGTSLSLLEAMSAQCAAVASDVGGITNILIDGYNGMIVKAGNSDQLYSAIKFLIDNPTERQRLAATGYETVKHGFSYEKWADSWKKIIVQTLQFKD